MAKEIEVELFIHDTDSYNDDKPTYSVTTFQSQCFVLIGTTTVKVPVPEVSRAELTAKRVDMLKHEKRRILTEASVKAINLDEQINELLAIEAPKEI